MSTLTEANRQTNNETGTPNSAHTMTYARARLWLGVSCVGFFTTLSAAALWFGVPAAALSTTSVAFGVAAGQLALFVLAYAALQAPFDLLGGKLFPSRFGRQHLHGRSFAPVLMRGVSTHATVLFVSLLVLHYASAIGGVAGVAITSAAIAITMLAIRPLLARIIGGIARVRAQEHAVFSAADEGFTGGIDGVLRPRADMIPQRWIDDFGEQELAVLAERRSLAVQQGHWLRGRVFSVGFVVAGAVLAALLTGRDALGTPAGTVTLSLWFTLWSFAGLLTLPTPSRASVHAIEAELRSDDETAAALDAALAKVDKLADDEPTRPSAIEAVFHPVPAVSQPNAKNGAHNRRVTVIPPMWDVARTSLFLGGAAGGLLGRAVHCNCGRPMLWVYLPSP
ncbi:MAG: hypothetical protein AAF747_00325 [Planctomycetota bacterium]